MLDASLILVLVSIESSEEASVSRVPLAAQVTCFLVCFSPSFVAAPVLSASVCCLVFWMLNPDSDLKRGSDVLRAAESDVNAQLAERGASHFDLVFYILHSED